MFPDAITQSIHAHPISVVERNAGSAFNSRLQVIRADKLAKFHLHIANSQNPNISAG